MTAADDDDPLLTFVRRGQAAQQAVDALTGTPMLPLTAELFHHPRVQADPLLRRVIATLSDADFAEKATWQEWSLYLGVLCGALMNAYQELDAVTGAADDRR